MAINPLMNQQDDDEQQGQPQGGGQGGLVGGGGGDAPQSQAPQAQQRGTGFVNIGRYLGAQKGAGGRMGQDVAGKLGEQTQEAGKAIKTAKNQFDRAAVDKTGQAKQLSERIKKGGTGFSDSQKAALKNLAGGQYEGPKSLTDVSGYQQAVSNVGKVERGLEQTGTQEGRSALVRDLYGNPTYSRGMSRLDSALLGASEGGREALAGARSKYGGIGEQLGLARSSAEALAGTREQQALQNQQLIKSSIEGAQSGLTQDVQNQLVKTQGQRQAEYERVKALLGADSRDMEQAGRSQEQFDLGQQLVGGDYDKAAFLHGRAGNSSKYLSRGSIAEAADVATAEQRAKSQALAELAGVTGFGSSAPAYTRDARDLGQAYNFDTGAFDASYQDKLSREQAAALSAPKLAGPAPVSQAEQGYRGAVTDSNRAAKKALLDTQALGGAAPVNTLQNLNYAQQDRFAKEAAPAMAPATKGSAADIEKLRQQLSAHESIGGLRGY